MYSDDEKRKQEMLQRIMQNKQEYDAQETKRKQEMFTRIMNNEKSPTAYKPKTSTSVTTRLKQKIQQMVEDRESSDYNFKKYGYGNIDLTNRPIVRNADGSISTIRSMSFNEDGKEILVPTIVNGEVVSDDEAIQHYRNTGEYLGKFDTIEQADKYAEQLHSEQAKMYLANNSKTNTNQKIDMSSLTPEQKKKLEEVQKQTNPYKIQSLTDALVNTGKVNKEQADKMVQQKLEADKEANLTNLSKNIANSKIGNTSGGKALSGVVDTINNAPTIIDSAMRGADNGGFDLLDYTARLKKKTDEIIDGMGTFGKVLAVANGKTEYLITDKDDRDAEINKITDLLGQYKKNNLNQIEENQNIVKSNSTTKVASKLNELAPSIGNNMAGAAVGAVNPVLGTGYFIGSAAGSYYDDGIRRGMNDDQALLYGAIAGTLEGVTEKFAVGESVKAGMLLGKGKLKQALIKTGINMGENFLQEAIMEPLQEAAAFITGGRSALNYDFTTSEGWKNLASNSVKAGIDGALSAILMEGATAGVQSAVNVQDKIENGQEVSEKEIQKALFDIQVSRKVDIEAKFKQEIQYQVEKASREYVENNNIQNLQQNTTKNQNDNLQQQITQTENKNGLNQNVEGQNKLEQRVSGDELLNTQDFIEEIKNVGADVDENGYVTIYHRTSKGNADSIYKNGKMSAKEDGIFFSTSKDGYNNSNYGDSVVKLKVPAEMLELDDIFDDEASVKIKLNNKNQQLDVNDYLVKNDNINEFNGYTQKEIDNISSDKISIANSKADIVKFAQKAKKVPGNFKMFVGKIANSTANRVKSILDIDIDNYNISLKNDAIRHTYNQHSNESETLRGQVPVTAKDFANIPIIVNEADNIIDAGTNKFGQKAITFEKNIDGNNVVVTYVSKKHKTLELQSFYKFKNNKKSSATVSDVFNTPDRTSKTDSGTSSSTDSIPQNSQNVKNTNLPTGKNVKETKEQNIQEKVSANIPYKDTTTKVRKHYKSIIESANTTPEAKAIAKELMGIDTYTPETNKSELERADEKIMNSTPESELNSLMSRATVGEKITPVDIAVGERLIQYYSKISDGSKLQDAIQATAMAGTTAGQTVQAMSLLNHMTPQGQAVWLQRSVDKMNNQLKKTRGKNAPQFTLTEDMLQKIVSSENQEQLAKNLDEVYKELGQQVSKSTMEKIDAWRYFSMLANPRTHIRNIVGNVAMGKVQTGKNKVAGVIEAAVAKFNPGMERTHTIVPASKEVKQFAKADIKNVTDRLGLTEGKLNPQTRLENNMKTFKHEAMNKTVGKLFDLNNKALEVEDGWGLKAGYAKALAEYMTANKLKPDTITDAQLSKARNYAVQQAKEATFHQENQLASLVNQLSNRNKFAKFGVDAVLPFKKTPMNIAKTGIEYSPVGLAKSIVLDTAKLRKGNITVNQYIDNISKGLTGTGIALVGYALAQAGILRASGGDDDKEKYEEGRGKQAFSIQIGDNTYSLDWLAPSAIPLFIGAEISALNKATSETKTSNSSDEDSKYNQLLKTTTNVLDAFTNSMNPMMEMSMLSGLASTLRSYEQGATQGITAMATNATKSYVNQFFPTAMGQVAKTMDEYERSTTSTKTGILPKAVDSTKNQIMAKVPGLRQMLPTKTDVWGNDMKQPNNIVQRALENAVFPYTRKEVNNNDVDQELVRLYEERGEKSVLPSSSLSRDLTFSGEKYKMTSEEFAKYKKDYGTKSYNLINDLVNSSDYKKLSDEDKQQALENVYKYAKEYAKDQYAKANDIDYKKDTMFKTAQELEKSGNVSSYFNYLAKTDGMKEKEKMNVLATTGYDNDDKKIIYTNTIGSDDSLYNDVMEYTGININEYLKYKTQEFTSDKKDNGTEKGETVSGSKKTKVYNYVNNMKITGKQRLLLLGTQYKLTDSERATLAQYVKSLDITNAEKRKIYSKLQGFTIYKDGRITY